MTTEKINASDPLDKWLGFSKFVIGAICGTALSAYLGFLISERELDIKELENLDNYFRYTMEGDVYDRIKLSSFFSTVISDEGSRNRWEEYNKYVLGQLDAYVLAKYEFENFNELNSANSAPKNDLQKQYLILEEKLRRLQEELNPVILSSNKSDSKESKDILSEVSYLELRRNYHDANATIGKLIDVSLGHKFLAYTLESVENSKIIQPGTYNLVLRKRGLFNERYSRKFDNHIGILEIEVPGRENLLIHIGNTSSDTAGAILVGKEVRTVNDESVLINSQIAYNDIYPSIANSIENKGKITITIIDEKKDQ